MSESKIRPRRIILACIILVLIAYSLYQARALILGPRIWVDSHKDGEVVHSELLMIHGRAKNVAWLEFNGRQIFTDEEGLWEEKLIVSEGLSIITIRARDRFGREKIESIQLLLPEGLPEEVPQIVEDDLEDSPATSTATTTEIEIN